MACGYSGYTWSIILGMIITGAARSIVVKLAYQSGFRAPLTVTLLYLLGQSFSLFVYGVQQRLIDNDYKPLSTSRSREDHFDDEIAQEQSVELGACRVSGDSTVSEGPARSMTDSLESSPPSISLSPPASPTSIISELYASVRASFHEGEIPNGSNHGLSSRSEERIRWVHRVPYYAKPVMPAVFNLLNSALRWASLVYIDASVAEMMISGLELTLSVVAARILRGRIVAKSRWAGVVIVAVGVIVIERANNRKHRKSSDGEESDDSGNVHDGARDAMVGVILIVLQSLLSVLQDIGEEMFMQAANFPATLMLGLEGLYGFSIGAIIYWTVGDRFGVEDIDSTMSTLRINTRLQWWIVGLPFLFMVTGIFNIKTTEVTSAMTRNVWKNMRTVLVWAIALGVFYIGNDPTYGEAWHMPESFMILFGFLVMCLGIVTYYWFKEQERQETVLENKDDTPKLGIV